MGTSKSYSGPNWPDTNQAISDAAAGGHPTPAGVAAAVQIFARDFAQSFTSQGRGAGFLSGGRGGGTGGGGTGGRGGVRARYASAGTRLASFVGTAQEQGLEAALALFDLQSLRDAPVEELCDELLERLTEPDGLLDDTALREAMNRTLEDLMKGAGTAEELAELLTTKAVSVAEVVARFYAHVLAVNFEVKEYDRIRGKMGTWQQARDFLQHARDYIDGFVEYKLSRMVDLTKYDLNSADAQRMADALNREVLEALSNDE